MTPRKFRAQDLLIFGLWACLYVSWWTESDHAVLIPLLMAMTFGLGSLYLRDEAIAFAGDRAGRVGGWWGSVSGRLVRSLARIVTPPLLFIWLSHWTVSRPLTAWAPLWIVIVLLIISAVGYIRASDQTFTIQRPYAGVPLTDFFGFSVLYMLLLWSAAAHFLIVKGQGAPLWTAAIFVGGYALLAAFGIVIVQLRVFDRARPTRADAFLIRYLIHTAILFGLMAALSFGLLYEVQRLSAPGGPAWPQVSKLSGITLSWVLTVPLIVAAYPVLALRTETVRRSARIQPHSQPSSHGDDLRHSLIRGKLLINAIFREYSALALTTLPASLLLSLYIVDPALLIGAGANNSPTGVKNVASATNNPGKSPNNAGCAKITSTTANSPGVPPNNSGSNTNSPECTINPWSWFTIFNTWFALTGTWIAPFFRSLYLLEDTCTRAYANALHRGIQSLGDHMLILGYQDLGQRFVRDQFERESYKRPDGQAHRPFIRPLEYLSLSDHVEGSRNILLPDGRLAKLITRLAVVDGDPSRIATAVRTPEGRAITSLEVTACLGHGHDSSDPGRESWSAVAPVAYIVPTIVGDPTAEETLDLAGFPAAWFVVSTMKGANGSEPAQVILERLTALARRGIKIPAVLSLHSSELLPHFTARIIDNQLPVHYVLPEHLGGLNTANVIHAAVMRFRAQNGQAWPRTVICGHGTKAFYVLDSFLKNLCRRDLKKLAAESSSQPMMIFGVDPAYDSMATEPSEDLTKWAKNTGLLAARLRLRELSVSRFVGRSPVGVSSAGATERMVEGGPVRVAVVAHEPRDYNACTTLFDRVWPDIIVFADPEPEEELRALRTVMTALTRLQNRSDNGGAHQAPRPLPTLVVSGASGQRHVMRRFEHIMVYYSSLCRPPEEPFSPGSVLYPAPWMEKTMHSPQFRGDTFLDVLDDTVQRLGAVVETYARCDRATTEAPRIPVEMQACIPDLAGEAATTIARLAALEPIPDTTTHKLWPSLGNTRVIALQEGGYLVRSYVYLMPARPDRDTLMARMSVISGLQGLSHDDKLGHLTKPLELLLDCVRRHPLSDEERERDKYERTPAGRIARHARFSEQLRSCCGMQNCGVEAFHKVFVSSGETVLNKMIHHSARRQEHEDALDRHFTFNSMEPSHEALQPPMHDLNSQPLAMMSCRINDHEDGLAHFMNWLLFRHLVREGKKEPIWSLALAHFTSYECHDERFAVLTCAGALQQMVRPTVRHLDPAAVVRDIVIKPVRHYEQWHAYASELQQFFSEKFSLTAVKPGTKDPRGARLMIERTGMSAEG